MNPLQVLSVILAAVALVAPVLAYRLGKRTERRNAERDHEERRPQLSVEALTKGHPRVQLVHQGGPVVDEVELLVLDPLPDTLGAGLLMETSQGTAVQSLTLPDRLVPGDVHVARVALGTERRGTALRLRITTRAHPPKRRGPRRPPKPAEWVDTVTVDYPHPARITSAVGIRIPTEGENAANRRRPHRLR